MLYPLRHLSLIIILLNCATTPLAGQQERLSIGQSSRIRVAEPPDFLPSRLLVPPPPPLPSGVFIPQAKVNRLIEDLTSSNESVSTQAEQRLLRGGPSAVTALKNVLTQHPDTYLSIVPPLLERFVRHADEESAWAAADELHDLTKSEQDKIRSTAEQCLQYCQTPLRERAICRFQQMGGIVNFSRYSVDVDVHTGELILMILNAMIDENWKGGEKGIFILERIPNLRLLYLIDGHALSGETIEKLKSSRPDLRIENRGRVQLGIQASIDKSDSEGVTIFVITPQGSAYKAGLRPNDVIMEFGGKRIESFPELVNVLKEYKPGDVVEVKYLRPRSSDDQEQQTKITLQGWKTPD